MAGSLLRWVGLLGVVLAVMGGLLGMHVVAGGSSPAGQPASGPMSMPATFTHVMVDAADLADAVAAHNAVHSSPAIKAAYSCPGTGHTADMAVHADCTPSPGSLSPGVPPPGTLTKVAPGMAFLVAVRHASADRHADPPSLSELSISRT